jgi:hypothetical protein
VNFNDGDGKSDKRLGYGDTAMSREIVVVAGMLNDSFHNER